MKEPPHEAVMRGQGFYNKHSDHQARAADLGFEMLREGADSVPLPQGSGPLVIADYGCSQGQNSLAPMAQAVAGLRRRSASPVTVVHTDLPGNDFSSLFETLTRDPSSYTGLYDDTYALAIGRSFFEQLLPPSSVALGWSATTTHWLSKLPCTIAGSMTPFLCDTDIREHFAGQSRQDWQAFLQARGAELAPGGQLVMVQSCAHSDGSFGNEPLLKLMDEAFCAIVQEKNIPAEVAAAATFPVWIRTPADYQQVGDDFRILDCKVIEDLQSPHWERYEADGDVGTFVAASINEMRAWSEAMLAGVLKDSSAVDAFYRRCGELAIADPKRLHLEVHQVIFQLQRRS